MQTSLFTNAMRPKPDDLFKPGSQNWMLFNRLLEGPILNREIFKMNIPKYTGRISEIRKALRPHLMDIKAEWGADRSHVTYRIIG